jgi:hypothetical protein
MPQYHWMSKLPGSLSRLPNHMQTFRVTAQDGTGSLWVSDKHKVALGDIMSQLSNLPRLIMIAACTYKADK